MFLKPAKKPDNVVAVIYINKKASKAFIALLAYFFYDEKKISPWGKFTLDKSLARESLLVCYKPNTFPLPVDNSPINMV